MTLASFTLAATLLAAPRPPTGRPPIWMMPPAFDHCRALRDLFDQPDAWAETRGLVNGVMCADHVLRREFRDDEIRAFGGKLRAWHMPFGFECGAVKEWATTGAKCFGIQDANWTRFEELGLPINALAFDEPFCCVRGNLKKPDAYAVEETAQFIALCRAKHPTYALGDIEPFPYFTVPELLGFVDALQARLKELGVRGLDFFRLDPDWNHPKCLWTEVKHLEDGLRQRGVKFSLIYWAADQPALAHRGLADDSSWYAGVMSQMHAYDAAGGSPDELMVESWLSAPPKCVPETAGFTFTQSVRDFCRLRAVRAETLVAKPQ